MEYLTEKGVDINRTIHDNDQGTSEFSLIHMIVQNSSVTLLQYLMENGADAKAEDKKDDTALEWAEYVECPINACSENINVFKWKSSTNEVGQGC